MADMYDHSLTEFLLDEERQFQWFIALCWATPNDVSSVYWVNWFVAQLYPDSEGEPTVLLRRGGISIPPSGDDALSLDEWDLAQYMAKGHLKWDGCHEFELDDHFCSGQMRASAFSAIDHAIRKAAVVMGEKFDGDPESA
jgi:hypothetical protein